MQSDGSEISGSRAGADCGRRCGRRSSCWRCSLRTAGSAANGIRNSTGRRSSGRGKNAPADHAKSQDRDRPRRLEISGRPQNGTPPPAPRAERPPAGTPRASEKHADSIVRLPNIVVDHDGPVAWRGTVDLTKTIARIEAGKRLRFANDGSVFENRERRLPRQNSGYYHEYVHPTPGLSGPGPQRVISARG